MDEHFDAVVVGSGFGGAVMALRLAEAGQRVCLLERGHAYPPNSFPRSPFGIKNNFWDPSEGHYGLFNVWSFRHMEAVISAGLGGGSLIYANVLIRKDEKWFVRDGAAGDSYEYWPVTRADLDGHYDRVEEMLNGQVYPFDKPPYDTTSKTRAMQIAAERLQIERTTRDRVDPTRPQWYLPMLAVTFANQGREPALGERIEERWGTNYHRRERQTCRLCGECDVGCNFGSKNTLDYNYITLAEQKGADIRTLCEVKTFAPRDGGGYTVDYVKHPNIAPGAMPEPKRPPAVPHTITATRLILSAGTLGSTYLLLKNRKSFPALSPTLGSRFCGNGDLLTFAFKCSDTVNGRRQPRLIDPSHGPVITSTFRVPDSADDPQQAGRGFYLQDAGYPYFVNWLVEASDAPGQIKRFGHFFLRRAQAALHHDPQSAIDSEMRDLLGDCELSAGSMPLLGMGRDQPDGKMALRDGKYLDVAWENVLSKTFFQRLIDQARQVSESVGAVFEENPLTHLFNRLITVHPLGGCPMGRNANEGIVDAWGEVWGYPNLFVADGSVMPGPVGANPCLTIAALSERFAEGIVAGKGGRH